MNDRVIADDTNERLRRFGRARRHSAAVTVLRTTLPVAALALIGGFAAAAVMGGDEPTGDTVARSALGAGEIVMNNPKMSGFDRNNRPFALEATAARQETGAPAIVRLDDIDAKLPTGTDTFAKLDASAGVYDSDAETLVLSKGVAVRDLKGMDMDLREARVDMRDGRMVSEAPVAVRSSNAAIDAQSVEVLQSGKRILFRDRVRMVIHNDAKPEEKDAKKGDKAALLGDSIRSTAPWIPTSKLSVGKFAMPAAPFDGGSAVVRVSGN